MSSAVQNIEYAMFWQRFSAIGRISLFSITLHFLLTLTQVIDIIEQKRLIILLYLPTVLFIYIFSFSNNIALAQYNLVKMDYGWVNIVVNNLWYWSYYFYYFTYTLISLGIIWKWKRKLRDKRIIKQANLIFITMSVSLILGSLIDVVLSINLAKPLPQIAHLLILLPIWAMYHSEKYYGVMKIEILDKTEVILTEEDQRKMFYNLGLAFIISGILNFATEYFSIIVYDKRDLKFALIRSGLLVIIGLSIVIIQRIRKKSIKEVLNTTVLLLSIPAVALYSLKYSTITIWAYPIIIIISSLIFSKRTLLVLTTIVAIITQRLIWMLRPEAFIMVDQYDYILRIGIFILVFWIGSYVNRLYVHKIKVNDYQMAFQKMNAEISSDFINFNQENSSEKITKLLSQIGLFFKVDNAYLCLIDHQNKTMEYSYEWHNEGVNLDIDNNQEIPLANYTWWMDQLERNKLVYIEDTNKMPYEASEEKKNFIRKNIKSILSVPVEGEDSIQGFIKIDSVTSLKRWSDDNIELLNIMSNLLSQGLVKMESEKEIEFMAYYDQLTKLPNKSLFEDRTNQAIHLAKRTGTFISVIFVNLDNFKSINDTMGHKGGDELLIEIAKGLVESLRKTDTVARFSGDEFMIMINNVIDYKDIIKVVDKVMKLFSNSFKVADKNLFITTSAGVAIYPVDGEDPETLIINAKTALYKAKDQGKNQYVLCTKDMIDEVHLNMLLSNDLYRAVERKEFVVYYQPQIDLHTGEITGMESLIRWLHPTRGMISPSVFIPLAEKNGLINIIGEWVLKTAISQNKRWQGMGLPKLLMGVNLSGIQFMNPYIINNIESVLKEAGFDPKYLEFEITESIAIKESSYALGVLNKLKKIGVSIAIDDFGTEYSSLGRLKIFPVDRIKIDMQFIQGIENNEKDRAITKTIINLSKSLGLNVLAEGVETKEQLNFLNQNMCDYIQGYYYYKPMPREEMEKVLIDIKEKNSLAN